MQADIVIIGAGAAGLMCALTAGGRGRTVVVIDHAKKTAEKIRISGGGRCNFTNMFASPAQFLSANAHFCKSALSRFTQDDFVAMMQKHHIAFHEKKLGQLFCDHSAQDVIDMLLQECRDVAADVRMQTRVESVQQNDDGGYGVTVVRDGRQTVITCESLVVASGGLSIPKIGASGIGYDLATQFGLAVTERSAALVPLTFDEETLELCRGLAGLSVEAEVWWRKTCFVEGLLFTHRGLSGPSILQISSYWEPGTPIRLNLAPNHDVAEILLARKTKQPKQDVATALAEMLPKRLASALCERNAVAGRLADLPDKTLRQLAAAVNGWDVVPNGTEGYRTAEVTLGGVDTAGLSSQTMQAKTVEGLFFIGEVVDVTGHLGGYNFQWAWSSGYVAGQHA